MILQLKEADKIIRRDLQKVIVTALADPARNHKDTFIAGRTLGQHALLFTFGYKAAIWLAELNRHLKRLCACHDRVFQGQFFGAVGTLVSIPEKEQETQKAVFEIIGLSEPLFAWLSSCEDLVEYMSVLGVIVSSFEIIGYEIVPLIKTEFSVLVEPFVCGKVSSSIIPL